MPTTKTTAGVALVAIVAVLVGCGGGSSGVSAGTYVKSICSAIGPFEKDVQSRSSALDVGSIKNASDGKTALDGFLNALVSDTDTALSKLKAAGTPSVKNGKAISSGIVSAFTQLKSALQQAATQAKSLPTSSPQAFKTAATALGSTVRNSMGGIGSSLSGLKSPELEQAAAKDPTCKSLAAGG